MSLKQISLGVSSFHVKHHTLSTLCWRVLHFGPSPQDELLLCDREGIPFTLGISRIPI